MATIAIIGGTGYAGGAISDGLRGRDRAAGPPAAALQRGLLRTVPGPREAEEGQGTRIVQDRGA